MTFFKKKKLKIISFDFKVFVRKSVNKIVPVVYIII